MPASFGFTQGTLISAASGLTPVQELSAGDKIHTRDGALQAIAWIGQTTMAAQGDLAPIVVTKGTLGNDRDLIVSPKHAILLNDWRAELLFGQEEVLVRAVDLLAHDGVYRKTGGTVIYYRILFETHQLILSDGVWSESLHLADLTEQTADMAARGEIIATIPDLDRYGPKAAPYLSAFEAACLT